MTQSQNWDRVQRRLGEGGLVRLNQSRVAVIGLGSLGSQTALFLAMSGVGNFILVDPDNLEDHNVVRHAADYSYVGLPKVSAVADLIRKRNPKAKVLAIPGRAQDHMEEIKNADLAIVAGLGSEVAQRQVGQLLREAGVPFLVGGVYQKGSGGEVFFVHNHDGPCYACFAHYLREIEPNVDAKVDYGLDPQEVKAEPGLGVHVGRVAVATADWALRFLLGSTGNFSGLPGNLLIVANDEMEIGTDRNGPVILKPGEGKWLTIRRVETCLVCSIHGLEQSNTIDELLNQ